MKNREQVFIDNLIVNGISPYHFYYDSISNLIELVNDGGSGLNRINVMNGNAFFPLEAFLNQDILIETVTTEQLTNSNDKKSVFGVAWLP